MKKVLSALLIAPALVACQPSADTFEVPVAVVTNTAPSISALSDQKLATLGRLDDLKLSLSDAETVLHDLDVSIASSNPLVVPVDGLSVVYSEGSWTASVAQTRDGDSDFGTLGRSDITITVSDGELADSVSFAVDVLPRINQYIAMGTHNSYHELGPSAALVADWNYSHDTLDTQLNAHRVRSFELDIHWSNLGYMQVYHVGGLDQISLCDYLGADPSPLGEGCLEMIKKGLDANPNHLPAMIMIEPKDVFPQDPQAGSLEPHWRDFDAAIREVFPLPAAGEEDRVITPSQVLGSCDTLSDAVAFGSTCGGWPHIDQARGKVLIFIMVGGNGDCTTHGRLYREQTAGDCDPQAGGNPLDNWVAFIENETGPNAAIARCDSPTSNNCFGGSVADAARQGVLVRTRSDGPPSNNAEQCALNPSVEACSAYTPVCSYDYDPDLANYKSQLTSALASGAQIISTEHPASPYPDDETNICPPDNDSYQRFLDYHATIDGEPTAASTGLTALCNPANQPAGCVDTMFNDAALD